MMDRPSTSTNLLFIKKDDDMSSYVTKSHLFGAQRALHQEQQAMRERIGNLATRLPNLRATYKRLLQPQARQAQARE